MTGFNFKNKNIKKLIKTKRFNNIMHTISMEELAELQQAISKKVRRKQSSNDNIIEEIADSLICIDFIMNNYKIKENDIQKVIDEKLERLDKRIKSDTFI